MQPELLKIYSFLRGCCNAAGTWASSACVTSLCKGRTAAVRRLPSPPPGKVGGQPSPHSPEPSLDDIGSCPCPTGCVSPAHKLPPALQTPAWGSRNCRCLGPTWLGQNRLQEDTFSSHLPLHSCSSSSLQLQVQPRCSSKTTSCLSVLASAPVWEVVSSMVMVLLPVEEATQETS